MFKRAMEKAGADCILRVVSDGQMAIDYLKGAGKFQDCEAFPPPHLVLLDLKLPLVPGLEVLKWLRNEAALHIPVVILSSSQEPADVITAYKLGANAYLLKTCDPSQLLEMAQMIRGFWLTHNIPPPQLESSSSTAPHSRVL